MKKIRDRIEVWFTSFGHLACRRKWLTIFICLLAAGAMMSQMPKIRLDTSGEGLLHRKDPSLVTFDTFRDHFGTDQSIIIALEPPEIFDLDFLKKLKAFHDDLEKQPFLDKVTSLINATSIRGEEDELLIEELLRDWPATGADLKKIKERVLNDPLFRNHLISADGRLTVIVCRPLVYVGADRSTAPAGGTGLVRLSENDVRQLAEEVEAISARYRAADFPVMLGGTVMAEEILKRMTETTMVKFTSLSALLIALLLFLLFRRLSGVILPLVIVNTALFSTLGLMAFTGVPVTLNTTILPSFLLAVGIGDSVHLLTVFYQHFKEHGNKEDAIAHALGHSGLAVLMTSLTTAAGLLSFVTAGIAPVANLGIFAAIGVMLAFVLTITLLPAALAVLPVKRQTARSWSVSGLDRLLTGVGDFAVSRPWPVIVVSVVLFVISLALGLQLTFFHNSLSYLPADNPIRLAMELIDRKMHGSISVEIVIDTGREFGLYEPAVMSRLEQAGRLTEQMVVSGHRVGAAISVAEYVKRINQALYDENPGQYRVPDSRELIAQELLLFENSEADDLERLVDNRLSRARLSILVPWVDAIAYTRVLNALEKDLKQLFAGQAEVTVTGLTAIICRTFTAIIETMGKSYLIAGSVITVFMILLIGSLRMGLLSMAPNFLPIVMGLGFMRLTGIPLDYSTIMVGGIAIGLAVDDTVHFFHNFRRYFDQTGDVRQSVHRTLLTTGRAMLFTTLILGAGFYILMLAELRSTSNFGLITGFTISVALLADFLLAPALLTVMLGRNKY